MVLDYSCLQGQSLSVCNDRLISTSLNKQDRLFLRSPNYPYEYDNSLSCSCQINTIKSHIKFLDFYLEEHDEVNICSRDYLRINNRSYCGSSIDGNSDISSSMIVNSSFELLFKTNDVITRKGFWLMINSEEPLQVSCNNVVETTSKISATTAITTTTIIHYSAATLSVPSTESLRLNKKSHRTLSHILILIMVFVLILLLLNLVLFIICWQRTSKRDISSKTNSTNRPFFCSIGSSRSSSSSISFSETPVLTLLDAQKRQTLSTRYIFQPNQQQLDTTPSTSTTTATGPYDDLNESIRQYNRENSSDNHSLYMQYRPTFSSPNAAYNRMIHFPPVPTRCHFSTPVQTFYPPQPLFDSQHIYETIKDGYCPYQRLAATLHRQQQPQCTCYCEQTQQTCPTQTHDNENLNIECNPETLV